MVAERADEGVLCEALVEREGVEVADAAAQSGRAAGARGAGVPRHEQGAMRRAGCQKAVWGATDRGEKGQGRAHYFSSGKLGGIGALSVRAQ